MVLGQVIERLVDEGFASEALLALGDLDVAGEARADAAQAVAEKDAANKRVAAAKAAVKESTATAEKTAAELEATNAKMQP